ncbi:MAG: acyl-CoA dehydrogenase family protein [Myxococcales bacterium]|nr:acyl-CoA dehydrogenase [Myxococcales bacterium]HIK83754.1 acyl-CoA dehydrogenase [Myxococcales bacterium]
MDFDLSDEQRLLQETVAQFIDNECPPARLRELFDDEVGYDPVLWKGLAELGLAGIHLPGEYGGSELEILDLAVVAETLGSLAAPVPYLSHSLASLAISLAGNADQQGRWLPGLASGDALATVALAEEDAGWLPEAWKMAAGETITGTKEIVEFGEHADLFVVGLAGGRFGVVERNASGVEIQRVEGADRTRRIARVNFENTPIEMLNEGGDEVAARVRDVGLVLISADAFGGATKLVEMSVEYAKNREQFGVTIGHFQALKHQLANMAVEIEPTRALYWYAAHALDHVPEESERVAAIAKSHITERYQQVARDATEAHGGIGFTWEGDTQIWFKRAMFDRVFMGTPRVHQNRAAELADW